MSRGWVRSRREGELEMENTRPLLQTALQTTVNRNMVIFLYGCSLRFISGFKSRNSNPTGQQQKPPSTGNSEDFPKKPKTFASYPSLPMRKIIPRIKSKAPERAMLVDPGGIWMMTSQHGNDIETSRTAWNSFLEQKMLGSRDKNISNSLIL